MKDWFKTSGDLDPAQGGAGGQPGDPEADRRRIARERARAKLGLYRHLGLYVIVNVCLVVLDLLTTPDMLWFHWPVAGWGIAIVVHFVRVYLFGQEPVLLRKLEERELRKMARGE